jgi:hypothetical protein
MRTSVDTSSLLIGSKISFLSSSAISFARNAVNEGSGLVVVLILSIKLMYAVDAGNFLGRPRPRLTGAVGTAEEVA